MKSIPIANGKLNLRSGTAGKKLLSLVIMLLLLGSTFLVLSETHAADTRATTATNPQAGSGITSKRAFFGWYRATQMPGMGWNLLYRTIDWAVSGKTPSSVKIVLFTYDGTTSASDPQNADGAAVYNWLINGYGASSANIFVHSQEDAATLPYTYYSGFDVAIYWNTYGYDSSKIIESGVPFITVSTMQTETMKISLGGQPTFHGYNDTFTVVNDTYWPTLPYHSPPSNTLVFQAPMWFDATNATGDGIPLVSPWHGGSESILIIAGGQLEIDVNRMFYCSLEADLADQEQLGEPPECSADKGQVTIAITNTGTSAIQFPTEQMYKITDADGKKVYPGLYIVKVTYLPPGSQTSSWDQRDWFSGSYVPPGEYLVATLSSLAPEDQAYTRFVLRDKGYVILMAGGYFDYNCDTNIHRIDDPDWDDCQSGVSSPQFNSEGSILAGTNNVYVAFRNDLGYSRSRIYYMYPCSDKGDFDYCAPIYPLSEKVWIQRESGYDQVPDAITVGEGVGGQKSSLESAIETWAAPKVNIAEPLYIFMDDHGSGGGPDGYEYYFTALNPVPGNGYKYGDSTFQDGNPAETWSDCQPNAKNPFPNLPEVNCGGVIYSADLNSWLDTMEANTQASTVIMIMACYSGGFITGVTRSDVHGTSLGLSEYGRVIITSSSPDEESWFDVNVFNKLWPDIRNGESVLQAFNDGSAYTVQTLLESNVSDHPLLDDNGDRRGHGYDVPTGSGSAGTLPAHGDGLLAENLYISDPGRSLPWIEYVQATSTYTWPPSRPITLQVKVETKGPTNVTAWMIPPDWTPPLSNVTMSRVPLEPFPMSDLRGTGSYTVKIPAVNFTRHAKGPTTFEFIVRAEDKNGTWAIPRTLRVEFTATGKPSADKTPPYVDIEFPHRGDVLRGNSVSINGTVEDDTHVSSAKLYVDGKLVRTTHLGPYSTSFFEFKLNTLTLRNGAHTFQVTAYDNSKNSATYSTVFWVMNPINVTVSAASPGVVGSKDKLTVTVTGSSPTGRVTWSSSGSGKFSSRTCTLSKGSCSVTYTPTSTTSLVAISASYSGDKHNPPAVGTLALAVTPKTIAIYVYPTANTNASISATVGETFIVKLNATASTGYDWNVSTSTGIQYVNYTVVYTSPLIGGPQVRNYFFKAIQAGSQTITLTYEQGFSHTIAATINLKVAVSASTS